MSVQHRRPPTWRLAPSPLPSPSQRPRCHPAPAVDLTAPRPRPSPLRLPSSCQCQRSVRERSQLRRPWPCRIQAAGIRSSNCPAFSPGTPARSLNESAAVPLANALDLWIIRGCPSPPHTPASWSEADFSLPWWSSRPSADSPVLQESQQLSDSFYRSRKAARSPQKKKVLRGVRVSCLPLRVSQKQLEVDH